MMQTLRSLAALLAYPSAELQAHIGELREAFAAERNASCGMPRVDEARRVFAAALSPWPSTRVITTRRYRSCSDCE